ncbi:MAG TPA: hypothetical protein VOB72_14190 [Candidatus Dormibacteraeota bacterium]|nr:hypothetical protein [Candidatus Dormibacteraeota bacterium]
MTDDEFLHAFFTLTLPHAAFHHRDHLRLAWLAARRHGGQAAAGIVAAGIRRYAEAHGHGAAYHETLTRFWVALVAHAAERHAGVDDFDRFLDVHPALLDRQLPLRHWTREALFAAPARAAWCEPDVLPLPF